ncbi:MAG: hypothetical protein M3A44_12695 [Gammaproteobacteria bacterium]
MIGVVESMHIFVTRIASACHVAVDPMASMSAVGNPALAVIAEQVQEKLKKVIESL